MVVGAKLTVMVPVSRERRALGVPVMALLAENDATADVHFVRAGEGLASRRVTPEADVRDVLAGEQN